MTTVAGLIERVYRDYLLPPDEQPARFTVGSGGINSSATALPVSTSLLAPEEIDAIAVGNLIDVVSPATGGELMMITSVTGSPPTSLGVRRNMYDSTAAAHAEGDLVYLAPEWPRDSVFSAVADVIEGLWPHLWTVAVEETYATNDPTELPAACEEILEVRMKDGQRWALTGGWELLTDFPLYSSGKAIQWLRGGSNDPIHVKYRAAAQRPTAESDDLADLGVEEGWAKAIAVGAVAQLASKKDLSLSTVDFITEAMEAEGFRAGQGADLRNSLLQFQEYLLRPLRDGLEARHRAQIVIDELL